MDQEEMEQNEQEETVQKEKDVKTGPWLTQFEGRVGHGNEKVGEKRRFRDACDAGGEGIGLGQGLCGEGGGTGGEKIENKRKKEDKHKQSSFEGKDKEESVEKRKSPLSEKGNEVQRQQHALSEQKVIWSMLLPRLDILEGGTTE
jgi:hypothetical protein